jgi:RHS repeat-associated protein
MPLLLDRRLAFVTLAFLSLPAQAVSQNQPLGPVAPYAVSVTPKGSIVNRTVSAGSRVETFWITNIGTSNDTYTITCWGTGGINCSGPSQSSVSLAPTAQASVTATYTMSGAGTGTLWLKAVGEGDIAPASDSGSYVIVFGAPIVDTTPYNPGSQNYSRCAQACFAVVHAQGTVPYFSLDAPRNVVLAYNSDRADPKPFVHFNVSPDPGTSAPSEYQLKVKVNEAYVTFRNGEQMLRFANPSPGSATLRIGGQLNAATLATGVYPMTVEITGVYGGTPRMVAFYSRLVVVNETNSTVARGWVVGGVQRLYSIAGGEALVTEGDGSAVFFAAGGAGLTGEFSRLVSGTPGGGSGTTRLYPDSTKVVFNPSGRMIEVRDRFNNITTITYDASNRVWKIRDPLNRPIVLTYVNNAISTIQDSAGRTTTITVDPTTKRLTAWQDPDGVSSTFGYDANHRLISVTNRAGATASFAYDTAWKVKTVTLPSVTFFDNTTGSPIDSLNAWQKVSVPFVTTSGTPFTPTLPDSVYARVVDPAGHVSRFTANRWGTPVRAVDPLGRVVSVTYSASGLPIRTVYPTGVKDTAAYNTSGLPTYVRAAGDSAINIRYGAWAQPDSVWGVGHAPMRRFIGANGRVDSTRTWGMAGAAVTRFTYEARGRTERVTDPEGHLAGLTSYAGTNGNRSQDSVPGGRATTYSYDAYGRRTGADAPGAAARSTTYDVLNRVLRDSTAGMPAVVYAYDSLFLRSVTDPKGQIYRFAYNAVGWTTARTDPANHADSLRYDREGQLRRVRNRRGQWVDFVYDAGHRMTNKLGTNTDTTSWTYSTDGLLATARSPWAVDSQFISPLGRVDSIRTTLASQTFTQRFRYTTGGAVDSVQVTGGGITFLTRKYVWDTNAGRLSGIRLGGGATTSLTANRDGQITIQTWPGGPPISSIFTPVHELAQMTTTASYASIVDRYVSFDSAGRIARQVNGDGLAGREFTYNSLGRLVRDAPTTWVDTTPLQEPSNPCTESTFYDPNDPYGHNCTYDQPPEAPPPSGFWFTGSGTVFDYDAVGNRLDQGGDYGTGNRIRQFAGCTYVTDSTGDGNVLSRTCGSEVVQFAWTAESRLAKVTVVGGDTLDFHYDASGRLVRKDLNRAVQAYFLSQGGNLLAELNGIATGKVAEYSYYPGLDNLHAVIINTTPYFAHVDGMGNVIALTDSAGPSVQRSYTYDAWGHLLGGTDSKPFTNADRARFKGALWLGPQVDISYMRARWYEPKTGRFLSEDPIGLEGGGNLYLYAHDDPVNFSDPTGTDECPTGTYVVRTVMISTTEFVECRGQGRIVYINGDDYTGESVWGSDVAWGDQSVAALWAGWHARNAWLTGEGTPNRRPRFIWPGYPTETAFLACPPRVQGLFQSVRMQREGGPVFYAEVEVDVSWRWIEAGSAWYSGTIRAVSIDPLNYDFWKGPVRGTANCVTGQTLLHGVGP